jgi:hypothetical protein
MLELTLASLGLSMRPLLSSVRAGMATDTMTGIDIGNAESGNTITITGSGAMLGTITTGIAVTGGMTMTVVAREATGTMTMKATAVGGSIDTNGTGC